LGLAAAYRTKFLKQEMVRRNMIRRGDMIIGKYKSVSTGKVKPKVSLVLDWVPFRGNIRERKLYVFDMDNLYPQLFKRLIKKVGGLEYTNTGDFTYMRVKMGEGPRDGSVTFNKYISDFIHEVKGVWKTYSLNNYKQINLVDFDYGTIFNESELPSRVTIVEKLQKLDEELEDVNDSIRIYSFESSKEDKEELSKLRKEAEQIELERQKLFRLKAQGRLT
jgi:hypothetical protein